ncbi:MAG TPA: alpha-galactosidase [Armatimonadetes bacterium]|nr:alpha-galactosidase [Armatimonadota bacterium]
MVRTDYLPPDFETAWYVCQTQEDQSLDLVLRATPPAQVTRIASWAEVDGVFISGAGPCQAQEEEVEDALGMGWRRVLRWWRRSDKVILTWEITFYSHLPVVALRAQVTNNSSTESLRLGRLSPCSINGRISLAGYPTEARIYLDSGGQGGFTGSRALTSAEGRHQAPGGIALLYQPSSGYALLTAFLSFTQALPLVEARLSFAEEAVEEWQVWQDFAGLVLKPGRSVATDRVVIGLGADPHAMLEAYGDLVAQENGLRPFAREDIPLGWCSWYGHRVTLTEDIVRETAQILAEKYAPYGARYLLIDHGWEWRDYLGEWERSNQRFPVGMANLARQIEAAGLIPALWVAPLAVCEPAPLFQEHPDWMVRDPKGQPWVGFEWWMCLPPPVKTYVPDATRPQVRAWLRRTFAQLRQAGYRFFKNDFLGPAARREIRRHDPTVPPGPQPLRLALAAMREGAGPEAHFQGCSGPTNLCLGYVDSMRVERDIGNLHGDLRELAQKARGIAARWYQHRRFWVNDPDSLVLSDRERHTPARFRTATEFAEALKRGYEEAKIRATIVALSGGAVLSGDDLRVLDSDREALLLQCLPTYGVAARPVDLFIEDLPAVWALPVETDWDAWQVVALFNWTGEERTLSVDFAALRLDADADYLVWEHWSRELRGLFRRRVTVTLAPHTTQLLRIRRPLAHPWVLSTDMHLTQGGVELREVRWDGETLSGLARRAPGAQGTVFVYLPATEGIGEVIAVPLEFTAAEVRWEWRRS